MSNHYNKYWIVITAILLTCLVSGGIFLAIKLSNQRPFEISLISTTPPDYRLEIQIDGAVANPGIYPAKEDDTIADLIQAAGLATDANPSLLKLYIPKINETNSQLKGQRISLNCADVWLLKALPGIGDSKAQAIVEHRSKYGPFLRIEDLLKVSGFGKSTLDDIRNFITVEY
jgi:competence protein ComEA